MPHHRYRSFLSADRQAQLFAWSLANRARFSPATVANGAVERGQRRSQRLTDLGSHAAWLDEAVRDMAPDYCAKTGVAPFEIEYVELEIAALGDGGHFAAHTDMPLGWGRRPLGGDASGKQDRIVSAVAYFHREPQGFAGGQLRLHGPDGHVDVEPLSKSLVVFPSIARHEVLPVDCPGGRFEDHRFAVNIWLCKTLSSAEEARAKLD